MDHSSPFLPLLLIMLLAVAVPFLVNHIRFVSIPIVVGEIIAGIIIGESGFNLVHSTPILNFLSEFGFAFLMFLSGLEVNPNTLLGSSSENSAPFYRRPVPLSLIYLFSTILLALGISYGLMGFGMVQNPLLMGLILSTTSLGIVVPILKERDLTTTIYGQSVLVAALVSDFVTLLLLSVVIAVISQGFKLDILLFMVLFVAFITAVRISKKLKNVPGLGLLVKELSHATAQIRVRGAFALLVTFVVLAEFLGVELILGAFLGGVLVSITNQGTESPLHSKLDAIGYGFFIPIFFINVGAHFNLQALMGSSAALLLVPVLILAAYLVKIVPAFFYKTLFNWKETFALGTLMSSRLSLIIAASAIALNLGLIPTSTNSAIILVAIVTCTLSPLLFSKIMPFSAEKSREGIVIFGTDQLATLLAQRLKINNEPITFIGKDQKALKQLEDNGFNCVFGNPAKEETLEQANLVEKRALIAVSNVQDLIPEVCRQARDKFSVPTIIARADTPKLLRELQEMKIKVVQPSLAVALAFEGALLFPAAFSILSDKDDDVEILDITLKNSTFDGKALRHLELPGNALILGIQRQGETIVPRGKTQIKYNDKLVLIGNPESLEASRNLFGNRNKSKS